MIMHYLNMNWHGTFMDNPGAGGCMVGVDKKEPADMIADIHFSVEVNKHIVSLQMPWRVHISTLK